MLLIGCEFTGHLQPPTSRNGPIDYSLGHEIAELAGLSVETVGIGFVLKDLGNQDGAVLAGIDGDLTTRCASGRRSIAVGRRTVCAIASEVSPTSSAMIARLFMVVILTSNA
jgi:hypothetical protein